MSFKVTTSHPIAFDSRDHTEPCGTKNDNSRWYQFNDKLYRLKPDKQLRIMDLGCSGGGFVFDCIQDGHLAIGLEGSDYSLLNKRAEWATIPENLFTCDVTKPFHIYEGEYQYDERNERYFDGELCEFDFITGWELMEHIWENDLPQMLKNCIKHLKKDGLMIFSINKEPQYHHVCVRQNDWWLDMFQKNGLRHKPELVTYFGNDWIRGEHQNAIGSFHVVLERII